MNGVKQPYFENRHSMSLPKQQAVIYARTASRASRDDGSANRDQELRCRDFAACAEYEVIAVFDDHASGNSVDRVGLDAMLAYLDTHRADSSVVIVDDITRLARGFAALTEIRKAIAATGSEIKTAAVAIA
jgi:DNA invertase Pin-like site-specific DNA recombinase